MQTEVDPASLALIDVGGNNRVTLPVVNYKGITTTLNLQSGDTVLLGGLIKQTDDESQGGVPGLSRIPFVGALFGRRNQSSIREELLVVIKPTVIRNSSEARRITDEYRSRFKGLDPLRVRVD